MTRIRMETTHVATCEKSNQPRLRLMTFIAGSDHQLAAVERLGVSARGAGLDSAQAHETAERLLVEPALVSLRAEAVGEEPHFVVHGGGVEGDVDIRVA